MSLMQTQLHNMFFGGKPIIAYYIISSFQQIRSQLAIRRDFSVPLRLIANVDRTRESARAFLLFSAIRWSVCMSVQFARSAENSLYHLQINYIGYHQILLLSLSLLPQPSSQRIRKRVMTPIGGFKPLFIPFRRTKH